MDNLLDDIALIIRRCESGADVFEREPFKTQLKAINEIVTRIGEAWSGSFIGYHANVYYEGLRKPKPGEFFDSEWGFESAYSSRTHGSWKILDPQQLINHIYEQAGDPDLKKLGAAAKDIEHLFNESKDELLASLDVLLSEKKDIRIKELRAELVKLDSHFLRDTFFKSYLPRQIISRDTMAMQQGPVCPPHLGVLCTMQEYVSHAIQVRELVKITRRVKLYLEKSLKLKGATVAKKEGKIFIGHGRSPVWRDLKDFIQDRLRLVPDEFNLQPAAGLANTERLGQMLDDACFAFLIMTAEDQQADGTLHARENVIHEAGLFQGRLGFRRAIVLLEKDCKEFSNIQGLGQIRFPKGDIKTAFEEIRAVLEREQII